MGAGGGWYPHPAASRPRRHRVTAGHPLHTQSHTAPHARPRRHASSPPRRSAWGRGPAHRRRAHAAPGPSSRCRRGGHAHPSTTRPSARVGTRVVGAVVSAALAQPPVAAPQPGCGSHPAAGTSQAPTTHMCVCMHMRVCLHTHACTLSLCGTPCPSPQPHAGVPAAPTGPGSPQPGLTWGCFSPDPSVTQKELAPPAPPAPPAPGPPARLSLL